MAISLHAECRARLVSLIAAGAPKVVVENNMFLARSSVVDAFWDVDDALPTTGNLRKQLADYIDERPLLEFLSGSLSYEFRARKYDGNDPKRSLTEVTGYESAGDLAAKWLAEFETLPWRYAFTIRLPDSLSSGLSPYLTNFSLSNTARLFRHDDASLGAFPFQAVDKEINDRIHNRSLMIGVQENAWEPGVYLQLEDEGFVGLYSKNSPLVRTENRIRAFLGLAVALQLCTVERSFGPTSTNPRYFVHLMQTDRWAITDRNEIPERHARIMRELRITYGSPDKSEEAKQKWIDLILTEIRAVFAGGAKAERVLLAAQWFFDSYNGDDQLLSFVQAIVVLEILLGDKAASDEIGLGELLRNRCAYLIGSGHSEREALLVDFNEIYRVRSQIVHRGKSKLTGNERVLFSKLHRICRRVIQKEVDLLRADAKAGA